MKSFFLALALVACFPLAAQTQNNATGLKLVPMPRQVTVGNGDFHASGRVSIVASGKISKANKAGMEMLEDELLGASGKKALVSSAPAPKAIYLEVLNKKKFPDLSGEDAERFAEEGYTLSVTAQRITVSGATDAGLFYGIQTLRQLIHPAEKGIVVPAVKIVDWPTMRWRGLHDDISRGPIPTLEYMKKEIRTLAEYKGNMFSLYMEHVFAYPDSPVAAPQEGAITPDEIKELVKYSEQYHVTLLPEQQAFGHLHHVLKNELFTDMAETPHGHVLSPVNEKSYQYIEQMYKELVPLFPGQLFHIGGDETWELGTGQTKAKADEIGLGLVYLEHLKRVSEILKPYNKRLMFWGDIALHYPELLSILPKDSIAVAWVYNPQPSFDKELKPFADAGLTVFVSPGANNWNRLVPDYNAAFVNVRNFVRDGQKYHALGCLNTTWDDDGEALFEMTWPPVVFAAAASWQSGESSIDDFLASYDWAFYRNDADHSFSDAVRDLAGTHDLLKKSGVGGAMDDSFWVSPFSESGARYIAKALPAAHDVRIAAETALERLYKNQSKAKLHIETLDALTFAGLRVDSLGLKVQLADEMSKAYQDAYANQSDRRRVTRDLGMISGINARLEDLRDNTERLKALYTRAWMAENRPYWLGSVLVRYDVLGEAYQEKIFQIKNIRGEFGRSKQLPKPEDVGFAAAPAEPPAAEAPKN
jgi:hexosaminidase